MKATYNGDTTVVFTHYLDVTDPEHPVTLVAVRGETYDIKQAEGHTQIQANGQFTEAELPMPPDGDWTEAKPAPAAKKKEPSDG